MNKDDKEALVALGALALLGWLMSRKKKGKCPRCNFPVTEDDHNCPNCGQLLNWGEFR